MTTKITLLATEVGAGVGTLGLAAPILPSNPWVQVGLTLAVRLVWHVIDKLIERRKAKKLNQ